MFFVDFGPRRFGLQWTKSIYHRGNEKQAKGRPKHTQTRTHISYYRNLSNKPGSIGCLRLASDIRDTDLHQNKRIEKRVIVNKEVIFSSPRNSLYVGQLEDI